MFNIAICDDEEQQRERVKTMLLSLSLKTNFDFQISLFTSGEQLLSHYREVGDTFNILILDVEMGGMNGIQTAKEIRNMKETQNRKSPSGLPKCSTNVVTRQGKVTVTNTVF